MRNQKILGGIALTAAFIGMVTFAIGNWTSWITTEGLTPMAWISSMSLVVAAIFGALWWMFKQEDLPAGCAFFALEGIALSVFGLVLWLMDGFQPTFVGDMFQHPFGGVLCLGLFAMTIFMAVNSRFNFVTDDTFIGFFEIVGAIFLFTTAMAVGGGAWIIPLDTAWLHIFAYSSLACMVIMTAMIVGTIATKKW